MNRSDSAGHPKAMRSARAATFTIFAVTGAMFGTWASRLPATQERLALSPGELAVALSGVEVGALIGLPLGAVVTGRVGSRAALRLAFAVFPTALVAVARAPGLAALVLSLVVFAATNSVVDVAMNAQGVELERRLRRPVLSGLHAGHPLGIVAGGSAGTAAAGLGVGLAVHFTAAAIAGVAVGLVATRWLVREPDGPPRPTFARPSRRFLVLGLVAFCATLVTSTAENWSAVALRVQHGAGQALGAATFTAYALAQARGRPARQPLRAAARGPHRGATGRCGHRGGGPRTRRAGRYRRLGARWARAGSSNARDHRRGARAVRDAGRVGDRRGYHDQLPRFVHRPAADRRPRGGVRTHRRARRDGRREPRDRGAGRARAGARQQPACSAASSAARSVSALRSASGP